MSDTDTRTPITGSPLTAAHILAQAYDLLVPQKLWVKEMWIDANGYDDKNSPIYTACSMGALLLVEHLEAERPLYAVYDDVTGEYYGDTDAEGDGNWVDDPTEMAVTALLERDEEFAKATKFLADAVRKANTNYAHNGDKTAVIMWNDDPETTWEDVKTVFQAAIVAAESAT